MIDGSRKKKKGKRDERNVIRLDDLLPVDDIQGGGVNKRVIFGARRGKRRAEGEQISKAKSQHK